MYYLTALFLIFETAIFILLHTDYISILAAYFAIVGAFVYALCFYFTKRSLTCLLLCIALLLTAVADIFLTVLHGLGIFSEIGVTLFLSVQILYAVILHKKTNNSKGEIIFTTLSRFIIFAVLQLIVLTVFKDNSNIAVRPVLVSIALFYVANSFINIVTAFLRIKQHTKNLYALNFAFGLLSLFICDLFIGLTFIGVPITTAVNLPWIFYLPSQVLLASCAISS